MTIHSNPKGCLDPRFMTGRMQGVPCFILGNGPSVNECNLNLLDSYFSVGINRIFYAYDPTVLIWQDLALWQQEQKKIMQTKAIKYVRKGSETRGGFYGFQLQDRDAKLSSDIRTLHGRGSSGSIAYQFVFALECNPIILVGMDCIYGANGLTDFYGNNPMHKMHTLPACVKGLNFINQNSAARIIINCSKNKIWEKQYSLEEAINMLPPNSQGNRQTFQTKLLGEQYEEAIKSML